MTVSHNRPYLPWHLAHILSISMHDAVVFSSKAKRLWPLYTSTKATSIFLFFSFFFLLFVILLLRYYIQCKYCIQVWINWTELNWTEWWYRPFPSSKNSHFQKEAKCETFLVIMSFIYIRRKKLFIPMVSHLVETWENLTCDQTFFFFFSLRARTAWETYIGMIEIRHDLRLWETRKGPQKCEKKQQQQQTSKELNDASLSLFICCWAVTNLKIEKINQIIPIIQSKYFSVSAWLNPGLIPFSV